MGVTAKFLRAIVRNDAMREDPDEIYGWRVFTLVFSACFGGMLFGWDTGAIGGILTMPDFQRKFNYVDHSAKAKSNMSQNIVSTLQAGCFAACFFTSWVTDRYGRRAALIGAGALTIVGIIFQAASSANGTLGLMYVGRFVAGLGIGAASALTPLYVSECAPRAIRGGLTGTWTLLPPNSLRLRQRHPPISQPYEPYKPYKPYEHMLPHPCRPFFFMQVQGTKVMHNFMLTLGPRYVLAFYQLFNVFGIMLAFWYEEKTDRLPPSRCRLFFGSKPSHTRTFHTS